VLTARFARTGRRYRSLTYALILKEVGVAMQTMYLVATAMDLAGCALGSGESSSFVRAAALDPLVEDAVGEFVLGSTPGSSP
jgi:SagB-type dehydrogenase family enzyme